MMTDIKRDFDKAAASWDENPGRVKMTGQIAETITGTIRLTPSMDVMDFGCGTGLLTLRLQPFVHSVTGVDSSRGMLDVLNTKVRDQNLTNVRTLFLDIEKGEVLSGSYHLITSSMTFHHIKDVRPVLDQFYNTLLPGGIVCIADLDSDGGQFHENNEGVFHFGFDRENLSRTIREAGFQNVECRTATKVTKPLPDGNSKEFSIFIIAGIKS